MDKVDIIIFRTNGLKHFPFGSQVTDPGRGMHTATIQKRHNKYNMLKDHLYIFNTGYGVEMRLCRHKHREFLIHLNNNRHSSDSVNISGEYGTIDDLHYLIDMFHCWKPFIQQNMM
tara:strand:+ start:4002 stop:4349 length:348 start_codon:yes stop_codon:yes gene_type:complete